MNKLIKLICLVWTGPLDSEEVQGAMRELNARGVKLPIILVTKPPAEKIPPEKNLADPGLFAIAWQKANSD